MTVDVLTPLAHDVPAVQRERQETLLDHMKRRIHLSDTLDFARLIEPLRAVRAAWSERPHSGVLDEFDRSLDRRYDVVLLSAYLQHFRTVEQIGLRASRRKVPVLVGGPMFNLEDVAEAWRYLPGVSAVVGAEVDRALPDIVRTLLDGGDLTEHPGVVVPDGRPMRKALPLRNLDDAPVPDFTDFPWDRYPVRIVPLMTGRGCQWDKCLFCSDVISASGRTFRTRSVESVLLEMQEQSDRHSTTNFLFLDLKLNSWPGMIRGIARDIGRYVRGAEWIGTVHVDRRSDNGLSRQDLDIAVEGGMRRVSFGLESGSQRLLDAMQKGSDVERNAQFIRDAHSAGLSVRCTMFRGFPGETAEDMEATVRFLEEHKERIDRIRFNEFTLHLGTPIWRTMMSRAAGDVPLQIRRQDSKQARVIYRNREPRVPAYRKAKAHALALVHEINRRPLRDAARQFDGLM
ncbi:B12-binding domain-containing radical SAM protein [Roseobacter cerasinus]|nr:radical SAM protein [Roseobacter cerasinus]